MSHSDQNPETRHATALRLSICLVAALCLGLCAFAAPASAAFEQVGTFGASGEEVQLGGVGGMAVNYTGAGPAEPGTVYVATKTEEGTRIAMFEPSAVVPRLKFVEGWQVRGVVGEYERCGPVGELPSGETVHPACSPRPEAEFGFVDVEVDQSTGNVYAYGGFSGTGFKEIVEYSGDGGKEITRFGEFAPSETVEESPGKIHTLSTGAIAVGGAGKVYVFDDQVGGKEDRRLMVFGPHEGNVEDYEYLGEVAANSGLGTGNYPFEPATDAAGNVYVFGGTYVEEYGPETPAAYPAVKGVPICHFSYEKGGITAMTVNPKTGEPFFYTSKPVRRIHQLGACNEATHEFSEVPPAFEALPVREDLYGMAFDPVREFSAARGKGVLYGAAPGPGKAVGQTSLGYIFAPVEENPPSVEAESVSKVGAGSARLEAQVDPKGNQAHFAFQYLSGAEYEANPPGERFNGAKEAPEGKPTLEGAGPQSVAVTVTGLLPEIAYRFRVVANSHCAAKEPEKVCVGAGEAKGFLTYAEGPYPLPDNRAWELVSPAQKHGGQVLPADPRIDSCPGGGECKPGKTYSHFPMQSTADGEAVAYEGTPFNPEVGATIENEYLARRTASGWETRNPTPRLLFSKASKGYKGFSADLGASILSQTNTAPVLDPEAPAEYANLYAQGSEDPSTPEPMLKEAPPHRPAIGTEQFTVEYAGQAADGSRVFLEANDALTGPTPFAPEAKDGGASKFNLYEWEPGSGALRLVNVKPGNTTSEAGATLVGLGGAHGVSSDGSRAFWADGTGQVYVREGGEATIEIPDHAGKFLAAASDGSKVLLDDGKVYDLEAETTVDLTEGKGGFEGLVGQSEDLTQLYFVDSEILSGENVEHKAPTKGKDNLYAWSEGGGAAFVATLAAGDNGGGTSDIAHDWVSLPSNRTAEASPHGRYLAFLSQAPLSGYDNTGPCGGEVGPEGERQQAPCPEAFVYDATSGQLSCASCDPSGAAPLGWSVLRLMMGPPYLPQARYLTDAGRLFFDSQDSLSPADTNEGVEDVYEWEPEGIGSCTHEGGCVALISAGRGGFDSNFVAADFKAGSEGANVFFTTVDRLVSADSDGLIDLYDARVGGGFDSKPSPAPCQGEACQAASGAPAEATPGSPGFSGPGNAKPAKPCKKGKVRKKGHCVAKHPHNSRKRRAQKQGGTR